MLRCYNSPRLFVELSISRAFTHLKPLEVSPGSGVYLPCWKLLVRGYTSWTPPLLPRCFWAGQRRGPARMAVWGCRGSGNSSPKSALRTSGRQSGRSLFWHRAKSYAVNKSSWSRHAERFSPPASSSAAVLNDSAVQKRGVLKHVLQLFHNW